MVIKIIKPIPSRSGTPFKWVVEYQGGSVYPLNQVKEKQKLYIRSEELSEISQGSSTSVRDDEVLILNEDGSCGGLFVQLPTSPILPPFTAQEQRDYLPDFCDQYQVNAEEVVARIVAESKQVG